MGLLRRIGVVLLLAGSLAGCATTHSNPADPLESFNRAMFSFNDTIDTAVLKPVAEGYRAALPGFVRLGVTNFFSNLQDLWIAVNNLLQGKVTDAVGDTARFIFNSTIGMFGLLDVSSDFGLAKHNEDFGQTLGRWGADTGPYLVLPIFGPSTVRDAAGLLLDFQADVVAQTRHVPTRNTTLVVRAVSARTDLLDTTSVVEEAALDKYSFVRDAWLQRRLNLVYDGDPPREQRSQAEFPEGDGAAALPAQPIRSGNDPASAASAEQPILRSGAPGVTASIHTTSTP
ncbi:MAG: VacJ family lipoprotein [Betaproteobacteria bacterium]|nr:VacJ family lipoprotein [Betaproteobacteria bacterium]